MEEGTHRVEARTKVECNWAHWHTPILPALGKAEAGGLQVQVPPEQLSRIISKFKNKTKWNGDVAQCGILGFNLQYQNKCHMKSWMQKVGTMGGKSIYQ